MILEQVRRAAIWGLKLSSYIAFLAPLMTRIVLGQAFFFAGRGKWANFERTVSFFSDSGIPFPSANAAFVSSLEVVGGICLILGLLTRLMAAGLASTMVVALLTADNDKLMNAMGSDLTDVTSLVFLLFMLWLALYGPGPFCLDHLLSKWLNIPSEEKKS